MARNYLYLLPIFLTVFLPGTIVVTYILAALVYKEVTVIFPYVSDTGTWSLARCIFTFNMTLVGVVIQLIHYIRYKQVKQILNEDSKKELPKWTRLNRMNNWGLNLSIPITLGVFLFASFQSVPYLFVHLMGAAMAFVSGTIVSAIQTYISFKIYPKLGNRTVNILRLIITLIIFVSLNVNSIFGLTSYLFFTGADITKWKPNEGGWTPHLVSVFAEWILILAEVAFIFLYTFEFKNVDLSVAKKDVEAVVGYE